MYLWEYEYCLASTHILASLRLHLHELADDRLGVEVEIVT